MPGPIQVFHSWGRLAATGRALTAGDWLASRGGPALPRGAGLSYGDTGLLSGGAMIEAGRQARIEAFDPRTGVLIAEPGVNFGQVIAHALPLGWFPPVTPGTRFVTLGGAAANDVHGKNHHAAGTFGRHVLWLDLARSDGSTLRCSPNQHAALFASTIGGMGLTGLITRIAVQLMPVANGWIRQDAIPFGSLDGFFALAAESDASHPYTVAWIDSLAGGAALGRGVFLRGRHDPDPSAPPFAGLASPLPLMPLTPPIPLVNGVSMRAFNALYRFANRERHDARVPIEPFFYPLDKVKGWNRAYGPKGLRQHQCALPRATARDAVTELLSAASRAGAASFLTVLKTFGDRPSPGLLSFPMPGATLTLDFAYRGAETDRLLATLDAIVMAAGGRVNPYKDARMPAEVFEASFPHWRDFAAHVDPAFTSDFWRRVTAGRAAAREPAFA